MKHLTIFSALLLFLLGGNFVFGDDDADYAKALTAFRSGNPGKAVSLWQGYAERGNIKAQNTLANFYAAGNVVEQDYVEATKWWRIAAEQGDSDAQQNLAVAYLEGKGIPKNIVQAYMWFNLSEANGNEVASLTKEHVQGEMTPAQIEEAQKLARECVAKNYKGC